MSRAKIIDHYLEKVHDPEFRILDVRKELEAAGVDEEEIRVIVRLVDNELQRKMLTAQEASGVNTIKTMGLIIFVLGAFITLGTYTGIIPMGNHFMLMYGPMGAGASLYLGALAKDHQTPGKFRKSR